MPDPIFYLVLKMDFQFIGGLYHLPRTDDFVFVFPVLVPKAWIAALKNHDPYYYGVEIG